MDDDLGVGASPEGVSRPRQIPTQLGEVVDLPVEHNHDRAILVEDGLVAGLQVDDAQSLDAQSNSLVHERAARVRTAMLDSRAHALDQAWIDGPVAPHLPRDAAHLR